MDSFKFPFSSHRPTAYLNVYGPLIDSTRTECEGKFREDINAERVPDTVKRLMYFIYCASVLKDVLEIIECRLSV